MRRALLCHIAAIVVLASHAARAAEEPTSRPATSEAAQTPAKAEPSPQVVSLDQVRARYDNAVKAARAQYLRDLNELKRRALKSENLREANAVDEQIRRVASERPPGSPLRTRGGTKVTVQANQDWQPSTIAVQKGDVVDVTARGRWVVNHNIPAEATYGPDGLRADGTADFHGQWATLIARIGPKTYWVGKGTQIVAEQDGVLEFRSNDFSVGDNQGAITVTVVKNGE